MNSGSKDREWHTIMVSFIIRVYTLSVLCVCVCVSVGVFLCVCVCVCVCVWVGGWVCTVFV